MGNGGKSIKHITVVIGVGNEYRRDDAVGLHLARRLKAMNLKQITIKEHGGEASGLMESWNGAGRVVIVDAVSSGGRPGATYRFEGYYQPIPWEMFRSHSTHGLGVGEAIELARTLDRMPNSLIVYGIEGGSFRTGVGLSPEVERAAETVFNIILKDIAS